MNLPQVEISFDVAALSVLIGTLAILFHRKVVIPVVAGIKKVGDTKSKIDKIYAELSPNGGASIRDAINRIEMRLVGVEQKQNVYLLESPQGIFETDVNGRVIGVNRTLCNMVGRTEKELMGMGWINAIAGVDRDRVFDNWTDSVSNKMEFHAKFLMKGREGNEFAVSCIGYPMESPTTKEVIGWLATVSKTAVYDDNTDAWK
jgi:PAS domain S-box-containing protein